MYCDELHQSVGYEVFLRLFRSISKEAKEIVEIFCEFFEYSE